METRSSIPCLQEPATGPYPEAHSTSLHPISLTSILISSSHLHLGLYSVFFPSGFPTKLSHWFSISLTRAACDALHPPLPT